MFEDNQSQHFTTVLSVGRPQLTGIVVREIDMRLETLRERFSPNVNNDPRTVKQPIATRQLERKDRLSLLDIANEFTDRNCSRK